MIGSPASSTQRLIKNIILQNADTAAATVTVIYNNNSTLRNIFIATLAAGDQLIYEDGDGWTVVDKNGNFKTSGSGTAGGTLTPYTPTVTASSGSITTSSATGYYQILSANLCWFNAIVTITTNGTGSGQLRIGTPFSGVGQSFLAVSGIENNVTGKAVVGNIASGTQYAFCTFYDASYPGSNGARVIVTGVFQYA